MIRKSGIVQGNNEEPVKKTKSPFVNSGCITKQAFISFSLYFHMLPD